MRERVKRREGVVVSAKTTKTVVVRWTAWCSIRLYGKRIKPAHPPDGA